MKQVLFDIDAPEFEMAKQALNGMMQAVLGAIMRGQTEDGTVVPKVGITSEQTEEGIMPTTDFKCTVSYKRKEDIDGLVHGPKQLVLEKGANGEIYGMTDAPEQMTMEEYDPQTMPDTKEDW